MENVKRHKNETNLSTERKPWRAPKFSALAETSETAKDVHPTEIDTSVGPAS